MLHRTLVVLALGSSACDCSTPLTRSELCDNGVDDDRNGQVDCTDSGLLAAVAGAKVNFADSFALSASVTVPLNREDPAFLPMFAVTLLYQHKRELPPEPPPDEERGVPPPPPQLDVPAGDPGPAPL